MGLIFTRGSSFFLGKVTALGVLYCFALFVCLTLLVLASFFHLISHNNMYHVIHATLRFQTHLNIINIIIDVKNKKLLDSIIITAKKQ